MLHDGMIACALHEFKITNEYQLKCSFSKTNVFRSFLCRRYQVEYLLNRLDSLSVYSLVYK